MGAKLRLSQREMRPIHLLQQAPKQAVALLQIGEENTALRLIDRIEKRKALNVIPVDMGQQKDNVPVEVE